MALDKIKEGIDFVNTIKTAKDILEGEDNKKVTKEIMQPRSIKRSRTFNLTKTSGSVEPAGVFTRPNFSIQGFMATQLRNILNGKLSSLLGGR